MRSGGDPSALDRSLRIRAEHASDHAQVRAIHEAAFGRPEEARLVARLRDAAHPQLSLVAEVEARVAGHVFFSPVMLETSTPVLPAAGLAPVGVDPAAQGRGIGSALVRTGLRHCPALGWQAVFLIGDPAYYARFGFVFAAPLGFRYRGPEFDRVLQVIELRPGVLRECAGEVRYHDAFAETGTG